MVSGKHKKLLIRFIIAFTGCLIVFLVHEIGHEWYMNHFRPRSHGVSLVFVMFYMRYIILPVIVLSAFIKWRWSLLIISFAFLSMFSMWFGTNPLRVILMFLSGSLGYVSVLLGIYLSKRIAKSNI